MMQRLTSHLLPRHLHLHLRQTQSARYASPTRLILSSCPAVIFAFVESVDSAYEHTPLEVARLRAVQSVVVRYEDCRLST